MNEISEQVAKNLNFIENVCFKQDSCLDCPLYSEDSKKCRINMWLTNTHGEMFSKPWMWCVPDIREDEEGDEGIWVG